MLLEIVIEIGAEQKTSSNGPFWSFFFRLYSQSSGGRDFSVKLFSLAKELYKDLRDSLHMMLNSERLAIGTTNHSTQ